LGRWRQDLLVVNNWTVMMEGAVLAAGVHSLAATLFFIIYYIVVVVVVLNLVIAYVIERYDEQFRLDHMLSQLLAVIDDHDTKHSHTAKDMDGVFRKHSMPRSALALAAGSDEPAGQGQGDDEAEEEEEARVLEAAKVPAALAELETLKFTDWARCGPAIRHQSIGTVFSLDSLLAIAARHLQSFVVLSLDGPSERLFRASEAASQLSCPAGSLQRDDPGARSGVGRPGSGAVGLVGAGAAGADGRVLQGGGEALADLRQVRNNRSRLCPCKPCGVGSAFVDWHCPPRAVVAGS